MISPKAIIADADGTLVNTVRLIRHGLYSTTKTYLVQRGFDEVPTYDEYKKVLSHTIGGSAHDTLERTVRELYKNNPQRLSNFDFNELHSMLNPIQDALAPEFITSYEGLSEFLAHLGKRRIKFAIFTSGSRYHVVRNFGIAIPELGLSELYKDSTISDEKKLEKFERALKDYFALPEFTVATCEDVSEHKPSPASLNLALKRLNVAPREALVLGDHTVDMQAARNAEVLARIGITHGFSNERDLREAGATGLVSSLVELANQLIA